ncbi:MAG: SAM-dependent methyltransferase [Tyzzerella sp.]|nr:SAM-dependent methyltransferase [Tyzzerella sp.]
MELSKRLQAVANLVSVGLTVADVGTDHGYIPIYLLETEKCTKAFAMDVNRGPLLRAKEHISEHGLEKLIETRLSDGVKLLQVGECNAVVIAGMGGALTIKIMEEGKEVFKSLAEFVLQPQSEVCKVREYLFEQGYCVVAEDMVQEDGKFYPMMRVINGEPDTYNAIEFRYGKRLLSQKHPVLRVFLEKEKNKKINILKNLQKEGGEHIEVRRKEIEEELEGIEYALQRYYEGD